MPADSTIGCVTMTSAQRGGSSKPWLTMTSARRVAPCGPTPLFSDVAEAVVSGHNMSTTAVEGVVHAWRALTTLGNQARP
eukprot:9556350-Karenia_brevis.AAC.1